MPAEARKAYFAVRAFNVEVASIKSGSVSRQVGGAQFAGYEGTDASAALRIRMQWWRDALDQIYNQDQDDTNRSSSSKNDGTKPPSNAFFDSIASSYMKNPVVRVLDYAVHEKQLTRRFLERLLEAREANLESKQPATLDEAVAYADETFASLFYLALETCGVRDDKADVVAQHAGIGVGLATSLRAAPWIILQDGECSIPQQVIPKQFPYHKLYSYYQDATSRPSHEQNGDSDDGDKAKSPTAKLNDEEFKMLKDAVEQVAALAYFHISMAQQLQGNVPKRARTCLLPAIPALHYLTKLEKANYNIFDGSVFVDPRQPQNQSNLTLLALLGRSWLTGVI
jgi:NADH dehydrogenase [ubiquinone] 1 alpha subcomplex assembly factor 6